MTLLLKDPDAELDYAIDWSADYLADDLIAASSWTAEPADSGGIAILGEDFTESRTSVKAGGGVAGRLYRITNQVTLASGRIDRRSLVLRVETR